MNRRIERVNGALRAEISRVLGSELKDPRLSSMLSVTRVHTNPDLRHARVYVSVFGDEAAKDSTLRALKSAAGFVHRSLRLNMAIRTVPSIEFCIDETIEQGSEVLRLIRKVAPGPETGGPAE